MHIHKTSIKSNNSNDAWPDGNQMIRFHLINTIELLALSIQRSLIRTTRLRFDSSRPHSAGFSLGINARGGQRMTPLHAAADKEHPSVAALLLERGADIRSLDFWNGSRSYPTTLKGKGLRGRSEIGAVYRLSTKDEDSTRRRRSER